MIIIIIIVLAIVIIIIIPQSKFAFSHMFLILSAVKFV
jgi:hypothetical protein